LFNQLKEVPSGTVFEDNPEVVTSFIPIVEFEDIDMVEVDENSDLREL
jgi:hypothetical protein